jgi:trehalose utilization protein
MASVYTLQREAGWIIVVGPGHEQGTGQHFDPSKSYLMKNAQDLIEALQKAYDAGILKTIHAINSYETNQKARNVSPSNAARHRDT